jgi:hypothetical protein
VYSNIFNPLNQIIMKIETMRKLIIAADSNQIPDQWLEKRNIQTNADVDTTVTDWIDLKKQVQGVDGLKADEDIAKWADNNKAKKDAKLG